mmetsp:Transcript_8935/g.18936  ORF Transcript_8935/g.18936 Transcript_8935/m.18936 type:complete len:419 (-) Transcript_8935:155-1411(-)
MSAPKHNSNGYSSKRSRLGPGMSPSLPPLAPRPQFSTSGDVISQHGHQVHSSIRQNQATSRNLERGHVGAFNRSSTFFSNASDFVPPVRPVSALNPTELCRRMDSERIAELSSNRTTSSVNVAVTALFFVISNVFWLIASGARQKGQSVHSFVQPFFPTLGIVYKVLNQFGPDSEIPPTLPQNAAVRYGSDDHPYNVNPEQHALIAEEGRDDASVRAIQEELSVMDMSAGEDILMGVPNSSTSNGEATSSNGRGSVPGVVGSGNFCSSDTVADDATLMSYVGYALSQEDFLKKDPAEISAYVTNGRIKSSDDCHRNYEWDKFWKPSLTKLFVHKFHESKKYMDILRKNGIDDQTEIVHSRDSYWGDRKPKRHSNLSNYWAVMFFGAYMTPELVEILKKKHRKQPEPDTTDLWASALSG